MSLANAVPSDPHSAALLSKEAPPSEQKRSARGLVYYLILAWGLLGVLALLGRALWRMTPIALEPLATDSLSSAQLGLYALWVIFNGYGEGYRAFQKAFCPRVVARAHHLATHPTWIRGLLAPLYCLSLFHANRKGLTVAWVMVAVIFVLVQVLGVTPQPWRGIVDGGVVVALGWGCVALLVFAVNTLLRGVPPTAKMNLPD